MKYHRPFHILILFLLGVAIHSCDVKQQNQAEEDQYAIREKPFTRWWWMGNAVTNHGITTELEAFQKVGIGGVEITPIYGVKGYESEFVSFLDSTWMNRLKHTLNEAERLGLLVDLNLGTGWPFGGPHIAPQHAAKRMEILTYSITKDISSIQLLQKVNNQAKEVAIESVIAVNDEDQVLPLTDQVNDRMLILNDTIREYQQIYVLVSMLTGQQVKRAAPGGEGYVMDHFDKSAVMQYLKRFDQAFDQHNIDFSRIRCFFNDSYEVYRANWTTNYLSHFEEIHAYDFGKHFHLLKDTTTSDLSARIASDYRKTLETLLQDNFTSVLSTWCEERGVKFRNQAHGSPGNLLDLYATVHIPETETFRSSNFKIEGLKKDTFIFNDRPNSLILKFASSAANTSGKQLVSSETATWLDEHFTVTLKKIKPEVDHLFVNGINHIFYHGTTYSPPDEAWPGWLFYASTHVNPVNPWWQDLKAFNDYIATCQHLLQNSKPDNDILLYWSAAESYAKEKSAKLQQFSIHSPKWIDQDLTQLALEMHSNGYTFDYISDQQLSKVEADNQLLVTKGAKYKVLVVPATDFLPEKTFEKINELSKNGIQVVFQNHIPRYFTGYFNQNNNPQESDVAASAVVTDTVIPTLDQMGISRESMTDSDLFFIRKKQGNNKLYFVVNNSPHTVEKWLPLSSEFQSVSLMDPLTQRQGKAKTKGNNQVYLQLKSGQSLFLFTHANPIDQKDWLYYEEAGEEYPIQSAWEIEFLSGGPVLPQTQELDQLKSWHEFLDGNNQYFSGTATYTTQFSKPDQNPDYWLLNLEGVHETVQVVLNGQVLDTLFSLPMEVIVPNQLLKKNNKLELKVSNLMANRMVYLERNDVPWKKFHDINFVNIHYEEFDASNWELLPSGLLKAPELVPIAEKNPDVLVIN